jgi:serine/threonine protein kinase
LLFPQPEMLLQQGHGKAVDWWCLGILTCEMLQGRHPFDGGSHYQVGQQQQ